ncbi:universal stress protein [Streptomyces sp. NPDC046332]|uniref:universal stress protein n=1 Tax=Streptomyces sp. NPDC046332 TaxID=3155133 RepID=UPI0033CA3F61
MTSEIPVRPERGDVVVGVDGSLSGRTAVLWTAAEADRRGRSLHLVHAADTDRRALFADAETLQAVREAGHDLLIGTASAVRGRFPDLPVTKEVSRREPVAGLRAAAGHRGTIVVGNRGLGGFSADSARGVPAPRRADRSRSRTARRTRPVDPLDTGTLHQGPRATRSGRPSVCGPCRRGDLPLTPLERRRHGPVGPCWCGPFGPVGQPPWTLCRVVSRADDWVTESDRAA